MDKKLYIQLQYPDDPCVGPVDSPRMDTLLSDILKSVADYEVTLQAGLSPCSCCGHRKTGQPQVAAGERAQQLAAGCSDCAVAYYCKTGRQGASPVAAALVEVYWVLECPEQSQLTDMKNTIATALFHSNSNQHHVHMTVQQALEPCPPLSTRHSR